jgi:galactonate dehydratase
MKIDRIQSFVVGNPWKNWVLVKVSTDEGHFGWGEATTGLTTKPAVAAVEEITRLFIGKDPSAFLANRQRAYEALYLPTDGVLLAALAAIETASWDILGKEFNRPLYRLLGGPVHDTIRVYANGWYQDERDPVRFAERAATVADLGYSALKFDPLGHNYRVLSKDERRKTLLLVEAVVRRLPDNVDLIFEFHDRLTPVEALSLARDLAAFQPLWIEDPVWTADLDAFVRVATESPVRIAGGERFSTLHDFVSLLSSGAVDVVLPEYLRLGGLHRLRQVAAIAEAKNAIVAPHNAQSPLGTAINIHFAAATPNFLIQECFDDFHVPWAWDIFAGVPRQQDGQVRPSEVAGLGVEIDEDALSRFPYGEKNFMNLFSKGWEKRNQY